MRPGVLIACLLVCLVSAGKVRASGSHYVVGPGKPLETPLSVPWEALGPGDLVEIHWRPDPYRVKWAIGGQGTAEAPITVRGVPGPGGELPIIDGTGATTAAGARYRGGDRSVVKVGDAGSSAGPMARHVVIERLDIRGGRPPDRFLDGEGVSQAYLKFAAPLWIQKGERITVRQCVLSGGGNGLVVSSSDAEPSRHILIEASHIHSNGNVGSVTEHNVYTAAIGMVFQFNRLGPLSPGAGGNNLKDRSAGLVVRCNWIEGGNRQLDLVHAQDSVAIRSSPDYRTTFVYGNVLIEPAGDGNRQIVQYGGDDPAAVDQYRKGLLHFYQNTVVSRRTDLTALFRLSTDAETCEARNNLFYNTEAGAPLCLAEGAGTLVLGPNWIRSGWKATTPSGHTGSVSGRELLREGSTPGFLDASADRFELRSDAPALGGGGPLNPAAAAVHPFDTEYIPHLASKARAAREPAGPGALGFAPVK